MHCVVSKLVTKTRNVSARPLSAIIGALSARQPLHRYSVTCQVIAAGLFLLWTQQSITTINNLSSPGITPAPMVTAAANANALFLDSTIAANKINSRQWLAMQRKTQKAVKRTVQQGYTQPRFTFAKITTGKATAPASTRLPLSFTPLLTAMQKNKRDNKWAAPSAITTPGLDVWAITGKLALKSNESPARIAARKRDDNQFVIMLDPGHGGSDPGSIGHNGLKEKVLTLDIAKRASAILAKSNNVKVLLTRDADFGMSRKNRVRRVKSSNADVVVSLHLNHLPQQDINLVETFYAAPHNIQESLDKQRSEQSKNGLLKTRSSRRHDFDFTKGSAELAKVLQKEVYNTVTRRNPDTDNAGVKQDTLYILTRSFTPGVLIELSCLSNPAEAEQLSDPAYRQQLAAALAKGIQDYLATPAAKGFFDQGV